jgi:hypothetical protein
MTTIKEKVLAYLRNDRKYATGARIYNLHGQNLQLKNQFNSRVQTGNIDKLAHSLLNESLAELAGISIEVMRNYWRQPLVPLPIDVAQETEFKVTETTTTATEGTATTATLSRAEELTKLKNDELIDLIQKLKPEFKRKNENKAALIAILIEQEAAFEASLKKPEAEKATVISELPEPVKQAIKLRADYPFLAERDCPPVLKALVGEKLEAYDSFRHAHEDLFTAGTFKEQEEAALAVIDNYLNNQVIFDELKHYLENKALLGVHWAVRAELDRQEVENLNPLELAKERSNLQKSIAKYQKQIKEEQEKGEAADLDKVKSWEDLVATKTARFNLIEARLETLK